MKIDIPAVNQYNSNINVCSETTAKINIDAFAFDALSGKNLYKDLYSAIIRELSCNAYDSHLMAGKEETPIYVHVPTKDEPYLTVRDYGIGLDDDGVRSTYMTYFGSTKRECEISTGAWGLGSKTPFGYTDNFSITAIKDGVKRIYVAYKNSNGMPCVNIMSEEQTDLGNGVEIVMPLIDIGHVQMFQEAARKVFKWFTVRPENNLSFSYDDKTVLYKDVVDGVDIVERDFNDGSKVVQANIAYNLNVNHLGIEGGVLYDFVYGGRKDFIIKVPNGSVNYAMSREELSYNEKTIETINSKLREAAFKMMRIIKDDISSLSYWDALNKLSRLQNVFGYTFINDIYQTVFSDFKEMHINKNLSKSYSINLFDGMVKNGYKKAKVKYRTASLDDENFIVHPTYGCNYVLVNDTNEKVTPSYVTAFCVDKNITHKLVVVNATYDEVVDRIKNLYGEFDQSFISRTSDYTYVPKKKVRSTSNNKTYSSGSLVFKWGGKYTGFDVTGHHPSVFANDGVKYYVGVNRKEYSKFSNYDVDTLMSKLGITDLYGLNPSAYKKIEKCKDGEWVCFESEVVKLFKAMDFVSVFKVHVSSSIVNNMSALSKYEDMSKIRAAIESTVNIDIEFINKVNNRLSVSDDGFKQIYQFAKEVENKQTEIFKKYPLLTAMNHVDYQYKKDIDMEKHMEYYIKSVNMNSEVNV